MKVLLKDPMIWGSVLVMPVVIIGLAVSWKKLKIKKGETQTKAPTE